MDALKERISVALSKQLIPKIEEKCKHINRNRSNSFETIITRVTKDETRQIKPEIQTKMN